MVTFLAIVFVIVCVLMTMIILAQKPKGGGLSGAFGGGGSGDAGVMGAKAGEMLTWLTIGFFVCYMFLAMGMKWAIDADKAELAGDDPAAETSTETGLGDPGDDASVEDLIGAGTSDAITESAGTADDAADTAAEENLGIEDAVQDATNAIEDTTGDAADAVEDAIGEAADAVDNAVQDADSESVEPETTR